VVKEQIRIVLATVEAFKEVDEKDFGRRQQQYV
jgi:hypothetical protein